MNLKIDDKLDDNLSIDKKMKKNKRYFLNRYILTRIKQIFTISTIPTMFLRFNYLFSEQSRKCIPTQVMYAHVSLQLKRNIEAKKKAHCKLCSLVTLLTALGQSVIYVCVIAN